MFKKYKNLRHRLDLLENKVSENYWEHKECINSLKGSASLTDTAWQRIDLLEKKLIALAAHNGLIITVNKEKVVPSEVQIITANGYKKL